MFKDCTDILLPASFRLNNGLRRFNVDHAACTAHERLACNPVEKRGVEVVVFTGERIPDVPLDPPLVGFLHTAQIATMLHVGAEILVGRQRIEDFALKQIVNHAVNNSAMLSENHASFVVFPELEYGVVGLLAAKVANIEIVLRVLVVMRHGVLRHGVHDCCRRVADQELVEVVPFGKRAYLQNAFLASKDVMLHVANVNAKEVMACVDVLWRPVVQDGMSLDLRVPRAVRLA